MNNMHLPQDMANLTQEEREAITAERTRRFEMAIDIVSGIVLLVVVSAFVLLCMAASGYHWE